MERIKNFITKNEVAKWIFEESESVCYIRFKYDWGCNEYYIFKNSTRNNSTNNFIGIFELGYYGLVDFTLTYGKVGDIFDIFNEYLATFPKAEVFECYDSYIIHDSIYKK